ncbi:hypothetical protein PPACK8108_LOCUS19236 [Phakopsora pachyrhizi]|uniref:Transketolase-like pyrimidine-binding domain-containing protein n=1 Tax=Phakopsora pachyrhizi TaxID=170000 RepID=A0AAV0BD63_PHAPC|nr:hypothetical protein PPACK8108_LOCUS19236 [Phakopsora pachyrhizi]
MSIPQVLAMRVAKIYKSDPTILFVFTSNIAPGPQDTKFLFDIFLQSMIACTQDGSFLPVTMPGGSHFENSLKNPRVLVKKVLVLGSGGLSIGQAFSDKTGNLAEIDYSTAEALAVRTILEEGYDIRLSGQDSGQGAFSQRNALLTDQVVERRTIIVNSPLSKTAFYATDIGKLIEAPIIHVNGEYPEEVSKALSLAVAFRKHVLLTDQVVEGRTIVPLNQLSAKNSQQGNLEIVNSPLSKYAVLGFELRLSYLTSSLCLTFWEAQFGNFVNTAQVAVESSIDQ